MIWKRRSLATIVALGAWLGWIESLNPDAAGKRKAKNIPAPIVAFARIVQRLVASPAGARAIGEAPSCTIS
jgi:hypothetical protein